MAILISFLLVSFASSAQEICDNGIDDDGNGLIDLNDPGCQCHYQADTNLLLNPSFETYKHCKTYPPWPYLNFDNVDPWRYGANNNNQGEFYWRFSCPEDSVRAVLAMPGITVQNGSGYVWLIEGSGTNFNENTSQKGYIGQCLPSPLKKGLKYSITFYTGQFVYNAYPFRLAIFGNNNCDAAPLDKAGMLGSMLGCPTHFSGWVELGSTKKLIYTNGAWTQIKFDFVTPEDINVIEIGPDCTGVAQRIDFLLDNFQLAETKDFHLQYIQPLTGNPCTGGYSLQAPNIQNATFQWYKNGIALVGQKNTTLNIPDSSAAGTYQVRMITSSGCQLSEPYEVLMSPLLQIKMPKDTFVCANDTLQLGKNSGGITYNWRGVTDTIVNIYNSGNYFIAASDTLGCKSNYTVQVSSQNCKLCDVYLPSGFTPNGDGLNDIFKGSSHCPIAEYHLVIYNRWGKPVFESTNINIGWDGKINGLLAETGTYVYTVSYKNSNTENTNKIVSGTVVILR